jgi:hypothetical protein
MIIVRTHPKGFSITSGNYIDNASAEKLSQKIDIINRSDEDALEDLYAETTQCMQQLNFKVELKKDLNNKNRMLKANFYDHQ